jgi:DNA-binding NtrC family response regulator
VAALTPLAKPTIVDAVGIRNGKGAFMTEDHLLQGKRILIVDDEPDVLETLEDLLPMAEVTTAQRFSEARDLMDSAPFDVAVLDVMGVDGYELLKIAVEKKITAVMLTARAIGPENVQKSFLKGAAYYIPKEEMIRIETFLEDILSAQQKGENTWKHWFDRMSAYLERNFQPGWQKDNEIFWEKFPFH